MSFGVGVGDVLAVLKLAKSVRGKWVDAPQEYASIQHEIKNVTNILRDINELEGQIDLTSRELKTLHNACSSCVPALESCDKLVDKYVTVVGLESGSRNRIWRLWKRLKLDPDDIRQVRSHLSSLVTQLTAIEEAIQIRQTSDMQKVVSDLRYNDDQSERSQIADWYAPASFASQQNEYSRSRQGGTGAWFLQDERYIRWRDGQKTDSRDTLLCPGIPGSGKTMMATAVIDDLHACLENEHNSGVAYFYCNFNRQEQQKLHQIYSSLVRQLFQERICLPGEVKSLYLKHCDRQTRPSIDELRNLLKLLAQRHQRTYIVIDALDECSVDNLTRDRLLHDIADIQNGSGNVKFLATTRFIPEIIQSFGECKQIEVRATKEDIERYLDNRMGELSSFVRRRMDLQQEIKYQIVTLVDGMFLLARLHFEALLGYTNATKLREALRSLPSGECALKGAYETALRRIDHQPKPQAGLARHVLTWLAYAKRELSVQELQEAVAVSMTPGMSDIDHDDDLDEPDELSSICAGLVVLDSVTGAIRLVHYTTQAYLESVRNEWFPRAQADIARSCVTYLGLHAFHLEDVRWSIDLSSFFERYKLLSYVGHYWGDHVKESDDASVHEAALDMLHDERRTCFASQVALITRDRGVGVFTCSTQYISSLHLCVTFDMVQLCQSLLQTTNLFNAKDSNGRTPLLWAASEGRLGTLQLLLNHPSVEELAYDNDVDTALTLAARNGHREAVELLLCQSKLDINAGNRYGYTALMRAVHGRHKEVVELLLRQPGIDVNVVNRYSDTAFMEAASGGLKEVVELFLSQPGIDINVRDKRGFTAIMEAASRGHKQIVELLLRRPEIDVNIKYKRGGTALIAAVREGHLDPVEVILCQSNADVNGRDHYGDTALIEAATLGHSEIVELLLQQPDVDVNAKNIHSCTALIRAVRREYTKIVELILRQPDLNINVRDVRGFTVLEEAATWGHEKITQLLLSRPGIDVNIRDKRGYTALIEAANWGHTKVVELLLLQPGVDVDIKNKDGYTAFSLALEQGYEDVAALLQVFAAAAVAAIASAAASTIVAATNIGDGGVVDDLVLPVRTKETIIKPPLTTNLLDRREICRL